MKYVYSLQVATLDESLFLSFAPAYGRMENQGEDSSIYLLNFSLSRPKLWIFKIIKFFIPEI